MRRPKIVSFIFCCFLLLGLVACGEDSPEPDDIVPVESETTGSEDSAADLELALMNAATAQESHLVSTGKYTASVDDLVAAGAEIPAGVDLIVAVVDKGKYFCMEAISEDGSIVMSIKSGGSPQEIPCE